MDVLKNIEAPQMRDNLPEFGAGDTIRVRVKVKEGEKERVQLFQGVVIGRRGGGLRASFTVRKVSGGVGVERIFPLHSPSIDGIEVIRKGSVRRAKIYYLTERKGKAARVKEKRMVQAKAKAARMGQVAAEQAAESASEGASTE